MQGSYEMKSPLNMKRVLEHQRLYLGKNSSDRQKALGGKKQDIVLLEKILDNIFLKTIKRYNGFVIELISTIKTRRIYLNHTHINIWLTWFPTYILLLFFFLTPFPLTILT